MYFRWQSEPQRIETNHLEHEDMTEINVSSKYDRFIQISVSKTHTF